MKHSKDLESFLKRKFYLVIFLCLSVLTQSLTAQDKTWKSTRHYPGSKIVFNKNVNFSEYWERSPYDHNVFYNDPSWKHSEPWIKVENYVTRTYYFTLTEPGYLTAEIETNVNKDIFYHQEPKVSVSRDNNGKWEDVWFGTNSSVVYKRNNIPKDKPSKLTYKINPDGTIKFWNKPGFYKPGKYKVHFVAAARVGAYDLAYVKSEISLKVYLLEEGTIVTEEPKSITGKWKWFNGVIITIDKYGNVMGSNGGKGTLTTSINNNYVIKWTNGYTDNLKLNGNTLSGKNQNGTNVWGERIILGSNNYTNENVWALNAANNIFKWNGTNWDGYAGKAQDIGVGANGSVWIMDIENHRYGGSIYRLEGSKFVKTSGQGVRIDVDPNGNPWGINNLGHIYKWENNSWHKMSGLANDIGIGANGDVWIIGTDIINSNHGIYKWSGTQWVKYPGAAVRIDVGPTGIPWVVNAAGDIFKFTNNSWHQLPGKAKDISVGSDGTAWVIGTDNTLGGHGIYRWKGNNWEKIDGGATVISAGGE